MALNLKMNWQSTDKTQTSTYYINTADLTRWRSNVSQLYSLAVEKGYEIPDYQPVSTPPNNYTWYADWLMVVIDDIDYIAEAIGTDFAGKPFYYANGRTPTAEELNLMERQMLFLYNRLNDTYENYLGTGYTGAYIANRLL